MNVRLEAHQSRPKRSTVSKKNAFETDFPWPLIWNNINPKVYLVFNDLSTLLQQKA